MSDAPSADGAPPLTCPLGHTTHAIRRSAGSLTAVCAACAASVMPDRVIIGRSEWSWADDDDDDGGDT